MNVTADHLASGFGIGDIASFDIFDTIGCRTWYRPKDVFLVLARCLEPGAGEERYTVIASARHEAEQVARKKKGAEPGLLEVYRELGLLLGMDDAWQERGAELEFAIEQKCARTIRATSERRSLARQNGQRVVYLSDTYLSALQLKMLLADTVPHEEQIFTSHDWMSSKRDGGLFRTVAAAFPGSRFHHVGDKYSTDYVAARDAGWQAEHFSLSNPSEREKALFNWRWKDALIASAVAGAAKSARLTCSADNHLSRQFASIGGSVVGPLFTAFTAWALDRAQAAGSEKILFLARDGQISSRIAGHLPAGVPFEYAYASRQSLYLPAIQEVGDEVWLWLERGLSGMTARSALFRFGLEDDDEAWSCLKALEIMPGSILTTESVRAVSEIMRGRLAPRILANAEIKRSLACDYFCELIDNAKRIATVDVGWKGRLQVCLSRIFASDRRLRNVDVHGLYLSLAPDSAVEREFSYEQFVSYDKVHSPALVEIMASADHGTTIGYRRFDVNKVVPLLAPNEPAVQEELFDLQRAAIRFAADLMSNLEQADLSSQAVLLRLQRAAPDILRALARDPERQEADCLGNILHSDDQGHSSPTLIAPILNFKDALILGLHGPKVGHRRKTYWLAGSLARSFRTAKYLVRPLLLLTETRKSSTAFRRRLTKRVRQIARLT